MRELLVVEGIGRRDRKRERTRSHVVSVAQALFAERGFANTTMEDVSRAADVAVQTVFNHVATKEELFFTGRTPWALMVGAAPSPLPGETWAAAVARQLHEATMGYLASLADPEYRDMAAQVQSVEALNRYERALHTRVEEALAGHLERTGISEHPPLTAALLLATTRVHAHDHRRRVVAGMPLADSLDQVDRTLPEYLGRVLQVTVLPHPPGAPDTPDVGGAAVAGLAAARTHSTARAADPVERGS